ncbi:MAG: hypothetical protein PVF91_03210 [Chromatiales bacterium]
MSLRTAQSYALAILALAAGAFASLRSGDWTWVSRSGSAVVAIGIVLTSHEIFEHGRRLQEHRRRGEERLERRMYRLETPVRTDHDWADKNSIRELIRSRSREEEKWAIEGHGFYMLVAGTLVWGFGDLLGLVFV